jgi:hypothetical protein
MSIDPTYDWPRPPVGGYTADDLDRLPNLPPHTEPIDGSLVIVSPQTLSHAEVIDLLKQRPAALAPPEWRAAREMTITLGPRNVPFPLKINLTDRLHPVH